MGGKTQTTTQQSSNTPTGLPQLYDIWNRVQNVASQPYTPYTGQMVAGLTPTQQAGIQGVTNAQGSAQPYFDTAADYARTGAGPIDPSSIQRYMSPYTQNVIDATRRNFDQDNAIQQNQIVGNAAAKGALGGDRVGVAQAEAGRQQRLAQDPVIAGFYSSAYDKALGAAQQDRSAAAQGAYTFGALAPSVQNAKISASQAQIGAGGLEQGTNQAGLTAAYNQYLQSLAFPYQQAGFLASAGLPAVGAMGGKTNGSTTAPGPSPLGQIAGLGIAGLGLATGNPMMAMSGAGSLFGGGGSSTGLTGNTTNPFPGYSGATTSYQGGVPYPMFRRGGRVDPMQRFHRTYHSIRRMMDGGPVIETQRDPNGIYVPKGYADGGDISPNDYVRAAFGDAGDAVASGAFDPQGANAMGPMAFSPPTAPIAPMPVPRPADAPQGPYALPPAMTAQGDDALPADAMAYDAPRSPFARPGSMATGAPDGSATAPAKPASGLFGNPLGLNDDTRMALMSAGLGMMASKSPFALSAIGEGGQQGVKTYQERLNQRQKVDSEAKRLAQQAEQFAQTLGLNREKFTEDKRQNVVTEQRQADVLAETRRQRDIQAMQPIKLGVDALGREIYGIRDPKTQTIKVIDPKTGKIIEPTAADKPNTPTSQVEDDATLPANSQPVSGEGTRNEEYLKSLSEADPNLPAMIKKIADYEINPSSLSTKGGHRERLLGMVSRYDPEFNQAMYPARAQAIKEFIGGGATSPAAQITAGNTAIQHAGDMSDAAEKMKAIPGILTKVGNAGVPFVSYAAAQLKNKSVRGTPEGQALADFMTARNHFAEEVTKFYAGSQGSEAERKRALDNLDEAKSVEELRAAVATETKLMAGKVNALQDRWKTALGGAGGWQSAIKRANVPDFPIIQQKSQEAIKRINDRAESSRGSTHAPSADRVRQNGHTYEKQPDGSYKAID